MASASRAKFIARAQSKFGDRHGYDSVVFVNGRTPVRITCKLHGPFDRAPGSYLISADGCPVCGEERMRAHKAAYIKRNAELYNKANAKSQAKMRAERPDLWAQRVQERASNWDRWSKTPEGKLALKAIRHRRRAITRGLTADLSRHEWEAICKRHASSDGDVLCAYCSVPCEPTVDHVVPLARGGTHDASNVVPACLSCNSSKGAKLMSEWKAPVRASA